MTHEERVFEMMKAIAPVIVKNGIGLIETITQSGSDPSKCTIKGMPLLEAEATGAMEWAEAFVKVFENANK